MAKPVLNGHLPSPIYLDYNATTPIDPDVVKAMIPVLKTGFGNPSSSHAYGKKARGLIDEARESVANLVGCEPDEVIFTSGGTESNNWAIKGAARALRLKGNHIVTTAIEHPAVLEVVEYLKKIEGFDVTVVKVDRDGVVNPDDILAAVNDKTILISMMLANNEVGSLQPVAEVSARLKGKTIALHTDASQALGKVKVDWTSLDIDLLTIAGHKLYAPKGVGALVIRKGTPLHKFFHGGGQEQGLRGGTESTVLIAGLGKACRLISNNLDVYAATMARMRDRLEGGIAKKLMYSSLKVDFKINGPAAAALRLPNTLSISFSGVDKKKLLEAILPKVACSAGAACHEEKGGSNAISPVLAAMGVPRHYAMCTLRLSTGRETTEEDIDKAVDVICEAIFQQVAPPSGWMMELQSFF